MPDGRSIDGRHVPATCSMSLAAMRSASDHTVLGSDAMARLNTLGTPAHHHRATAKLSNRRARSRLFITRIRAAANWISSGSPSSCRQISGTAG